MRIFEFKFQFATFKRRAARPGSSLLYRKASAVGCQSGPCVLVRLPIWAHLCVRSLRPGSSPPPRLRPGPLASWSAGPIRRQLIAFLPSVFARACAGRSAAVAAAAAAGVAVAVGLLYVLSCNFFIVVNSFIFKASRVFGHSACKFFSKSACIFFVWSYCLDTG